MARLANLIFEEKKIETISPLDLDEKFAKGWRHFGKYFFRYNMNIHENQICQVLPLRIDLNEFQFSKKHRKIVSRAKGFKSIIRPTSIDEEKEVLFEQHKTKFKQSVPNSIYDFLSEEPATIPCQGMEVSVYDNDKLIAASFFDIGEHSISSIYGMYDLSYNKYSLGIYTMLVELEYSISHLKKYYYHGYCYQIPSFYDYKKRFAGVEYFNWNGLWLNLEG
ncbi:MAG: arginine-tRNA-protein transferase [Flammeovirgaceae bacterium]|nr:arginine-tRNA-protein transferase [Flammeovirgaceae bacterium]